MAFVSGLMGPYMRPIPVGASAAMLFSLLVAFIVNLGLSGFIFLKSSDNSYRNAFSFLLFELGSLNLIVLLASVSPDAQVMLFWVRTGYFCSAFIPASSPASSKRCLRKKTPHTRCGDSPLLTGASPLLLVAPCCRRCDCRCVVGL